MGISLKYKFYQRHAITKHLIVVEFQHISVIYSVISLAITDHLLELVRPSFSHHIYCVLQLYSKFEDFELYIELPVLEALHGNFIYSQVSCQEACSKNLPERNMFLYFCFFKLSVSEDRAHALLFRKLILYFYIYFNLPKKNLK